MTRELERRVYRAGLLADEIQAIRMAQKTVEEHGLKPKLADDVADAVNRMDHNDYQRAIHNLSAAMTEWRQGPGKARERAID